MKNKLNGKIAVISGASSGIGLAIAKRVVKNGGKVINISKNQCNDPMFLKSFACDISDDMELKKAVAEIEALGTKIDFLFCNAGFGIGGAVANAKIEAIDNLLNVNLIAHIKMTNLVLPLMQDGGKIVFTGSLASLIPLPYQACYSASKAGIENFARALRTELKSRRIAVTTILPGDINTNFTDSRIKMTSGDKAEANGIKKMENFERKGSSPDTVAKVAIKVLKRKNPPLRVSVSFGSKCLAHLAKILPIRLLNYLVEKIYI